RNRQDLRFILRARTRRDVRLSADRTYAVGRAEPEAPLRDAGGDNVLRARRRRVHAVHWGGGRGGWDCPVRLARRSTVFTSIDRGGDQLHPGAVRLRVTPGEPQVGKTFAPLKRRGSGGLRDRPQESGGGG